MSTWISDKFKFNAWIMPQVQVPKGDGKRCSRSHSRAVMIAYHQIQNACRATGAHATHYCLDYFTIRLFTNFWLYFSYSFVHCLAFYQAHSIQRIWWWQNNPRLHVLCTHRPVTRVPASGAHTVRNNSLNFTPPHWLIKRELLFIQRMKGCR